MDAQEKRNFYRKCKEDIEWYLSTEDKEDYAIMYRLLGESVSFKFVQFETDMAEDLMKYLREKHNIAINGSEDKKI